ncbi:MAG: hypothetical protein GX567_03795 [Clostridia bacterium]|nr:hypothetical protein [Clostridia bacterium]
MKLHISECSECRTRYAEMEYAEDWMSRVETPPRKKPRSKWTRIGLFIMAYLLIVVFVLICVGYIFTKGLF